MAIGNNCSASPESPRGPRGAARTPKGRDDWEVGVTMAIHKSINIYARIRHKAYNISRAHSPRKDG